MTKGKLIAKSGKVIIDPCARTTNVFDRIRGLLLRPAPVAGAGLLIDPCASIHTFGMSYPIDVVYLDAQYRVLRTIDAIDPWRLSVCRGARMTLELAAGQAEALGFSPALELQWLSD
jgi:hypothetical protein